MSKEDLRDASEMKALGKIAQSFGNGSNSRSSNVNKGSRRKKITKNLIFLKKKEKNRRPMIILVEDAISPKVDATSCPSYGLPKLRLVYPSFP